VTAVAPVLESFFTQRLMTQQQASGHTIASNKGHLPAPARLRPRAHRQAARPAGLHRPGRPAGQRLPELAGNRPGQQRRHPQRPARGDPVAVHLRRVPGPRALSADHPGAGHPRQTARPGHRVLPHPQRDRGAAGRARHRHLARPPRPRAAGPGMPDRAAGLRAHRPRRRRRPPRHRAARVLPRERPQGTLHPAHRPDRRRAHRLGRRARRHRHRPAVLHPSRRAAQPRRRRAAARQARGGRREPVPVPAVQACLAAYHASRPPWPCCTQASTSP
jgi:hypothetical protein